MVILNDQGLYESTHVGKCYTTLREACEAEAHLVIGAIAPATRYGEEERGERHKWFVKFLEHAHNSVFNRDNQKEVNHGKQKTK